MWKKVAGSFLALCLAAVVYGQAFSSLNGNITDPTGAVVPGVQVILSNVQTGVQRTTTSDEQGRYSFAQVAPGTYQITAQVSGFKDIVVKDARLLVNTPTTLSLRFEAV